VRLGIADALAGKLRSLRSSQGPAEAVAVGDADIALTQISEILPYEGVELVGPLPSEVQLTTAYVAAVGVGTPHVDATASLIKFITAPAAAPLLRAKGLNPAG
jgi:molybdate transport system substrate-binding protein